MKRPNRSFSKHILMALAGVWLLLSCSLPGSIQSQLQSPTSTPASQVEAATPGRQVSPTPSETPFALPGGRLLFAFVPNSEVLAYPDPSFDHYSWLQLPERTAQDIPYLVGKNPVGDEIVVPSPDFSRLVVGRTTYKPWTDNSLAFSSAAVLLVNPADGSTAQISAPANDRVLDNPDSGASVSWSANSQSFAFTHSGEWIGYGSPVRLYVYDTRASALRKINIQAHAPDGFALSPDATRIAFTDGGVDPPRTFLIDASGGNQRPIFDGWVGTNLVWHPDGKRLFFVGIDPVLAAYSVDVSTGTITQLTPQLHNPGYLSLSPDGSLLSYEDGGLYVVDPSGGDPRQLLEPGIGRPTWVWSPDSQYIAYTSIRFDASTSSRVLTLNIMNRAGNGRLEVYGDEQNATLWLIGWGP